MNCHCRKPYKELVHLYFPAIHSDKSQDDNCHLRSRHLRGSPKCFREEGDNVKSFFEIVFSNKHGNREPPPGRPSFKFARMHGHKNKIRNTNFLGIPVGLYLSILDNSLRNNHQQQVQVQGETIRIVFDTSWTQNQIHTSQNITMNYYLIYVYIYMTFIAFQCCCLVFSVKLYTY